MTSTESFTRIAAALAFAVSLSAAAGGSLAAPVAAKAPAAPAVAPGRSPLEGKWIGHAGPADNTATVGLEFVAEGPDHALVAYATTDLANAWRQPAGPVDAGDAAGAFTLAGGQIKLHLDGATLSATGFLHDPDEAVALQRATALPVPPVHPAPPRGPGPVWQVRLGGAIFAPAAVDADAVYVGNVDGVFCARRLADGALLWTLATGRPFMGEALVDGEAVYVVNDNGQLYRLDRKTGKVAWQHDLGGGASGRVLPNPSVFDYDTVAPNPLLVEGVLYVGSRDGSVHAVRAEDGALVWKTEVGSVVRTGAVAAGDTVVVATRAGQVAALARADGTVAWTFDAKAEIASPPAHVGDRIIVGTRDSVLHGLESGSGRQAWSQYWWGSWVESSAVAHDGLAYIGSGDLQRVSALQIATGRNAWRTEVGGWVMQRPAVSDASVYAGVSGAHRLGAFWAPQQGGVVALERAGGKVRWFWPLPDAPSLFLHGAYAAPVLAGTAGGKKLAIVGGLDGSLYAFPAD
jgi:outer membrane protein assembly factor BamB